MPRKKKPYPLNKQSAAEVLAYGGFKGKVDLDDQQIRDAVSAAYDKGVSDGKWLAEQEAMFPTPKGGKTGKLRDVTGADFPI